MPQRFVLTALVLFLLTSLASSADKPAAGKQFLGTWERQVGDSTLTLDLKQKTSTIELKGNGVRITVSSEYGITKDSILYGIVTKVDREGTADGPAEGDLFSFRLSNANEKLTISDLKGTNVSDEARRAVEGEYKKK